MCTFGAAMEIAHYLFLLRQYAHYRWHARNAHGLHSPFVFQLYAEVIGSGKQFYAFEEIEKVRKSLLYSNKRIEVTDLGAGSRKLKQSTRKIAEIVQHSAVTPKKGALLFRLVEYFRPEQVLELGTSVGIGTLYLQLAHRSATIITFEGCPHTAAVAQKTFEKMGLSPSLVVGNLEDTLPQTLEKIPKVDLVYMDANHTYQATLHYFESILPKLHENSVVVVDDIRWSADMKQAWDVLCQRPEILLSLDLFDCGILLLRNKQPKQHFHLLF